MSGGQSSRPRVTDHVRISHRDHKLLEREIARARSQGRGSILCPCTKCEGLRLKTFNYAKAHVMQHGRHPSCRLPSQQADMDSSDEEWDAHAHGGQPFGTDHRPHGFSERQHCSQHSSVEGHACPPSSSHGNNLDPNTRFQEMLHDFFRSHENTVEAEELQEHFDPGAPIPNPDVQECEGIFDGLGLRAKDFEDAFKPVYEGSTQSVLEYTILLINICAQYKVPNTFVDAMLSVLSKYSLPQPNKAPTSMYFATKLINHLGFGFETIDVCVNGCVLFRKEFANLESCPKCHEDRYERRGKSLVARNKMRYFPIIPRLLRMLKCPAISKLFTWVHEHKSEDGLVRHVGDSKQWKLIDNLYPDFAVESRNVRFGLVLDGVNPFNQRSTSHSTWPIMLVNYCLPPWLATKPFFVMLTCLISGPKSPSRDHIDVYLQPLVEELSILWHEGVDAYDCLGRNQSSRFRLRAMLMFTVSDYPALGLVSGLCVHGRRGCVVCGGRGRAKWSNRLGKPVHDVHRIWLPEGHAYRGHRYADRFNGQVDDDVAPPRQSAADIFAGAEQKSDYKIHGVWRKSIFFDLPYWEHLLVRHCIDVMHMEKNVCDSLLGYLLGTKDTVKVREDLKDRGVRDHLWMVDRAGRGSRRQKPKAPYVFSPKERKTFLTRLKSIKVPDGYSSRWEKCVDLEVGGGILKHHLMKSHDFHVLMQQLLPACLRGLLEKEVREAIFSLSRVFQSLCSKVYDPSSYSQLRENCILTLCKLEMYFPPSFFDVMTHLVLHAVEELDICGPVHTRWMYFGERLMGLYASYVISRATPEASIARCYSRDESLGYSTEYMNGMRAYRKRVWDSEEEDGVVGEVLQGAETPIRLSPEEQRLIHDYVLRTVDILEPLRREYEEYVGSLGHGDSPSAFADWVQSAVHSFMHRHPDANMDMLLFAHGPKPKASSYTRMHAYGNHYKVAADTVDREATYESGLLITALDEHGAAIADPFVGELTQILHVDYGGTRLPVILFKAKWVRPQTAGRFASFRIDSDGFRVANFKQLLLKHDDPYVFPSVVHQVFFLREAHPSGWRVVLTKEPRGRRIYIDPQAHKMDDQVAPTTTIIQPDPSPIARPDPLLDTEVSINELLVADTVMVEEDDCSDNDIIL